MFSFFVPSLLHPITSFAKEVQSTSEGCKKNGYSIFTVNGMWTEEEGAVENMLGVENILPKFFNGEPLEIGYLFNPSHIAGIGDVFDVLYQKLLDSEVVKDFDLFKVHSEANEKIKTEKLLLVGHSQGNFYTNSLYDLLVDKEEGVPKESLRLYGVATPSGRVAGGGEYITSENDSVINIVRAKNLIRVLPANVNIKKDSTNGHSFIKTYLEKEKERVRNDILKSLSFLRTTKSNDEYSPCIGEPEPNIGHKIVESVLSVIDPLASGTKKVAEKTWDGVANVTSTLIGHFSNTLATIISRDTQGVEAVAILGYENGVEGNDIEKYEIVNDEKNEDIDEDVKKDSEIGNMLENSNENENEININESDEVLQNEANTTSLNADILKPKKKSGGGGGGGGSNSTQNQETENEEQEEEQGEETIEEGETGSEEETEEEQEEEQEEEEDGGEENEDEEGNEEENENSEDEETEEEIPEEETPPINQSSYTYISTPFGIDDEGNDWQVWSFNGSNIYDWSSTYDENGYLTERFRIETYKGGFYTTGFVQMGIFTNGDPRLGFELEDILHSPGLEGNPQNTMADEIFEVVIKWREDGYEHRILNRGAVYSEGFVPIEGIDENMWIGWNGANRNFRDFSKGYWKGVPFNSPMNRTGGGEMILDPHPVYVPKTIPASSILSLPSYEWLAGDGIEPSQGREKLTMFSFGVIFTDSKGIPPERVTVIVKDKDTNEIIRIKDMQTVSDYSSIERDGDLTNGELFYYMSDEAFLEGEYEYYFEALLSDSTKIYTSPELNLRFRTVPSTYSYIPTDFGLDEEGKDWQIWAFNGSYIHDWVNSYEDSYLRQDFKMTMYEGMWTTDVIVRGLFNHDPQLGFELSDIEVSPLEDNIQNRFWGGHTYDISTKWDSGGYSYHMESDEGEVISDGYRSLENVSENLWIGWNGLENSFKDSSRSVWLGIIYNISDTITGGKRMMLTPLPVFKN